MGTLWARSCKILVHALGLSALVCSLCACCSSPCEALPPEWKASFKRELWVIIERSPKYTWGGSNETTGIDCSHLVWLAASRAAIPGISYQTAKGMADGLGGWRHRARPLPGGMFDSEAMDLVWFTFPQPPGKPARPFGHVGVLVIEPTTGLHQLAHASQGRGRVVVVPWSDYLVKHLVRIGELSIGDTPDKAAARPGFMR